MRYKREDVIIGSMSPMIRQLKEGEPHLSNAFELDLRSPEPFDTDNFDKLMRSGGKKVDSEVKLKWIARGLRLVFFTSDEEHFFANRVLSEVVKMPEPLRAAGAFRATFLPDNVTRAMYGSSYTLNQKDLLVPNDSDRFKLEVIKPRVEPYIGVY